MTSGSDPARPRIHVSPLTRIMLVYTFIRVVLFVAVAAILWGFGMNDLILVAVALVASGVLSYPLARRQRTELAERLAARREGREHQHL
jgi:UPF0716 family protein affecting phage T7 exclusion